MLPRNDDRRDVRYAQAAYGAARHDARCTRSVNTTRCFVADTHGATRPAFEIYTSIRILPRSREDGS